MFGVTSANGNGRSRACGISMGRSGFFRRRSQSPVQHRRLRELALLGVDSEGRGDEDGQVRPRGEPHASGRPPDAARHQDLPAVPLQPGE